MEAKGVSMTGEVDTAIQQLVIKVDDLETSTVKKQKPVLVLSGSEDLPTVINKINEIISYLNKN